MQSHVFVWLTGSQSQSKWIWWDIGNWRTLKGILRGDESMIDIHIHNNIQVVVFRLKITRAGSPGMSSCCPLKWIFIATSNWGRTWWQLSKLLIKILPVYKWCWPLCPEPIKVLDNRLSIATYHNITSYSWVDAPSFTKI